MIKPWLYNSSCGLDPEFKYGNPELGMFHVNCNQSTQFPYIWNLYLHDKALKDYVIWLIESSDIQITYDIDSLMKQM
jgi:hypothetical protein